MHILVTGGAGFIGSALVRHLVGGGPPLGSPAVRAALGSAETGPLGLPASGRTVPPGSGTTRVTVVDAMTYAANEASLAPVAGRCRLVRADICDRASLDRVFAETQPDAVMHLAAESHVDRSITGSAAFIQTNIVGTHTLLEATRGYWMGLEGARKLNFRFLHVSTDEVYGSLEPGDFFTEATPYDPRSPYSASKAASDHLVSAWHETYGLPVVTTNCSNNYGPYHFPEKLIPLVILNALEGKPLPVYGDGRQERDWLYVDDHVRALVLALEKGRVGETYLVGGRAPRTNLDVVERICDLVDRFGPPLPAPASRRGLIEFVADRPGHDRRYAIDCTKIETELGWRARETFETGLEKTVRWYLANEAWWKPLRQRVYGGERLGVLVSGSQPEAGKQVLPVSAEPSARTAGKPREPSLPDAGKNLLRAAGTFASLVTSAANRSSAAKRVFDVGAALGGLVVLAPVVAVAMLAIWQESHRLQRPGPALFAQARVGRGGRVFTCWKLRTMHTGTANLPTHLAAASAITPLGAKLRRWKLDEVPQLVNVLRGEMSLVGPRPCLPSQTELVAARDRLGVYTARPGITGLAQVQGIDMSVPDRLALVDADYVRAASFTGDLRLILATLLGQGRNVDRVTGGPAIEGRADATGRTHGSE